MPVCGSCRGDREEGGGQETPSPAGQFQAGGESVLGPGRLAAGRRSPSCRNGPAARPGSGLGNEVLDSRLRAGQWAASPAHSQKQKARGTFRGGHARPRLQVHHQSHASELVQRLSGAQASGATWLHCSHLGGCRRTGVRWEALQRCPAKQGGKETAPPGLSEYTEEWMATGKATWLGPAMGEGAASHGSGVWASNAIQRRLL